MKEKTKSGLTYLFVLVVVLVFSAPTTVRAQLSAIDDYAAFGYGDAVKITIWESWERAGINTFASNFNGEYVIDGEGFMVLPIFGKINVIGMTPERLADLLRQKLAPFTKDPIILVVPLIRITLVGQLGKPGSYRVDPSNSLWDIFRMAGGPNPNGDLKRTGIRRGGETIKKDLFETWEEGYSLKEIGVKTGDVIFIHARRRFSFRQFMSYFQFAVSIFWLVNYFSTGRRY